MKTSPQLETSPVKELVRAGHEFAAALGADTPLIEIAKLVSRLATELDVQLSRANTLASLSTEPVAFINGAWTLVYYRPPKELGLKIGDKLFAASPVQVLPNKWTIFNAVSFVAENKPLTKEESALLAWNACRDYILTEGKTK
ncbi:hypothetical protein ACI083_003389 [Cronobacter sakazakii]|uniref:hypothetical protein n=1 Tax=Enterobacteriaceae TaxID=543 RepID=UPI001258B8F9|nr:hypothetical protein [Enterobacter hormaechei]ELI9004687.1 hypothetical protein [Enterobacter roggenkampii]VAF78750.1 Uncharacterised protein [Enterobacter hormaechei]HCT2633844.1 hypothetical protein [Enterobacter roggenkampii]